MKTTTVRLDDDHVARLEVIARVNGRAVADEIREAVASFLDAKLSDPAFLRKAGTAIEEIEREAEEKTRSLRSLLAEIQHGGGSAGRRAIG